MAQILLVEDELALLEAMEEELKDEGYEVQTANNGLKALEKLANYVPDMIISDISMPEMDGYGLLQEVRERFPKLIETPFIFLTAFNAKEDIIKGKKLGADDYMVKPVDFEILFATIESRLGQIERMTDLKEQQFLKLYSSLRPEKSEQSSSVESAQTENFSEEKAEDNGFVATLNLRDAKEAQYDASLLPATGVPENKVDNEPEDEFLKNESHHDAPLDLSSYEDLPSSPFPENASKRDVLGYVSEHGNLFGISLYFENIKAVFDRSKRNNEINLNSIVSKYLSEAIPNSYYIDAEQPGCVNIYGLKPGMDASGFNPKLLALEAQREILNGEVGSLITNNIQKTFFGRHLRVSYIPFELDMTPDEIATDAENNIAKLVRTKLNAHYNEAANIQHEVDYVHKYGRLAEATFRSRDTRRREVKFFHFDHTSEIALRKFSAFAGNAVIDAMEFQRDLLFLEKLQQLLPKLQAQDIIAVDVHFDTIVKSEKIAVYQQRYNDLFSAGTYKVALNVRGIPRQTNENQCVAMISKLDIKYSAWLIELNPWADSGLDVEQFKVPYITWNFFDVYGFNSKLEHLQRMKLLYKRSHAALVVRDIPQDCDIMFLKGYGFDSYSFNAE